MEKIVLIGYMGSGKTKIGKILSKKINFSFLDLDNLIENQFSKTINEIFSGQGEIFFRKIEHDVLLQTINLSESFVLSLGGGTPCYANNLDLLKKEGVTTIYLKASIDTLTNRLEANRSKRPLLKDLSLEEFKEYIAKHLFERSFYYNQSQHTVIVDGKSPETIVAEIDQLLF
jgi:shikimate kinase